MNVREDRLKLYPGYREIIELTDLQDAHDTLRRKRPYLHILQVLSQEADHEDSYLIEDRIARVNKLNKQITLAAEADRTGMFIPPLPSPIANLLQQTDRSIQAIGTVTYAETNGLEISLMHGVGVRLLGLVAGCGFAEHAENPAE